MNRICWWLVESLSELLDADERDAVRGDLTESGQTGVAALRDVCGLLLRRQAQFWNNWRPWVILVCFIIPLGILLSIVATPSSTESAAYFWLYANNWDWSFLANHGFWYVLYESVRRVLGMYLTLACFSWTAGFVLGRAARRLVATNQVLFCLTLSLGALVGAPRYVAYIQHVFLTKIGNAHAAAPPFRPASAAQILYGWIFSLIVDACFVAIPALWAMSQGARAARLRPAMRRIVWIAVIASIAVLFLRVAEPFVLLGANPRTWPVWQMRLLYSLALCLSVAVYWPIAYLAVKAIGERRRESKAVLA